MCAGCFPAPMSLRKLYFLVQFIIRKKIIMVVASSATPAHHVSKDVTEEPEATQAPATAVSSFTDAKDSCTG